MQQNRFTRSNCFRVFTIAEANFCENIRTPGKLGLWALPKMVGAIIQNGHFNYMEIYLMIF